MGFSFAKKRRSFGFRFTALIAVALVVTLSVFSASPELHAWLHSHERGAQSALGNGGISDFRPASLPHHPSSSLPQDDDDAGCVITLFAQGILAAGILFLLSRLAERVRGVVPRRAQFSVYRAPRYWLPPLCGPPLS